MKRKFKLLAALVLCAVLISPASSQTQRTSVGDTVKFDRPFELDSFRLPAPRLPGAPAQTAGGETSEAQGAVQPEALSPYGFDLFDAEAGEYVSTGSNVLTLPTEYRLGPGDRLGIYLVGNVQEAREVVVNVEGKIYLPPAGVLFVWGLRISEFVELLTEKLSSYYDNFSVEVMLLEPKNVLVSVAGEITRPGKYVLSALNTVLDAVIVADGPTPKGSLRNIQLIRDGKPHATVDLYSFLMSNRKEPEIFLEAGDRIFVPLAESRVTVTGEVKRPSIFELQPEAKERLTEVIDLAGGMTEFAFLDKIEISRLQEDGRRRVRYVIYRQILEGDSLQNLVLQNQDRIRVYSKLEQIHPATVAIFGEVRKPGTYPLEENMRLSDLILKAGNLTRKAYTLEAEIAKVDPHRPTEFLKVNLEEMFNGKNGHADIFLDDDDQVFIREIPDWDVGLTVEVRGEVKFPGRYPIVKDSTYLSQILRDCGGFTDEAFPQEAFVMRSSTRMRFDKEFERLQNMRRDEMTDLEYQYFVMRQNSADLDRIVVDFERLYYHNDRSEDIILEDGDVIVVPKAPTVVSVTGRVAKPGGITYVPEGNLRYYLARAGGVTWDADLSKTKVIKVTGEVLDDEDVDAFHAGDIIWVPRKEDFKFWPVALQTISVLAQLASIYLIIDTSINR